MKQVNVEIIDSTPEMIKLKVPFTPVPIEMNHEYFKKWWLQGYFRLQENQGKATKGRNHIH